MIFSLFAAYVAGECGQLRLATAEAQRESGTRSRRGLTGWLRR